VSYPHRPRRVAHEQLSTRAALRPPNAGRGPCRVSWPVLGAARPKLALVVALTVGRTASAAPSDMRALVGRPRRSAQIRAILADTHRAAPAGALNTDEGLRPPPTRR